MTTSSASIVSSVDRELSVVPRPASSASFSRTQICYLLLVTLIGAVLRLAYQYDRPLTFDEVGTLLYLRRGVAYLLSHFDVWLTMNYFIVLEKGIAAALGEGTYSLGLISLLSGIGAIPLTALVALDFASEETALLSALFVALNPSLVRFSAIARAYALLMVLSLATLLCLLRWLRDRTATTAALVSGLGLLMTLAHPNGVYTLAFLGFLLAVESWRRGRQPAWLRELRPLALGLGVTALVLWTAYARLYPQMADVAQRYHYRDTPPTSIAYVPILAFAYFGRRWSWVSVACLFAGLHSAVSREKGLRLLLPGIVLPVLLMSLQGISEYPWAYARFMIASVPLLLILTAAGVRHLACLATGPRRSIIATALAAVVAFSWGPEMVESFALKTAQPWHKAAHALVDLRREDDPILTGSWLDWWHLQPYLAGDPHLSNAERDPRPAVPVGARRGLYFITSDIPIRSEYSVATLGQIQILRYPSGSPDAALDLLREDLVKAIAVRAVGPEWTSAYGTLVELNRWLGMLEGQDDYHELWARSAALTPERRYMPRRMRLETEGALRPPWEN